MSLLKDACYPPRGIIRSKTIRWGVDNEKKAIMLTKRIPKKDTLILRLLLQASTSVSVTPFLVLHAMRPSDAVVAASVSQRRNAPWWPQRTSLQEQARKLTFFLRSLIRAFIGVNFKLFVTEVQYCDCDFIVWTSDELHVKNIVTE